MLKLSQPVHPKPVKAPGHKHAGLSSHPAYCHVCTNFSPETAYSLLTLRTDVFVQEDSGTDVDLLNGTAEEGAGDGVSVPDWAGISRMDRAAWQVSARLPDVKAAAERGCPSCWVLNEAIERVSEGRIDLSRAELDVGLVYHPGSVLRVWVSRIESEEEDEGESMFFPELTERVVSDLLLTCELYTLPGHSCPWPTISSSMTAHDPQYRAHPWIGGKARHVPLDPHSEGCFNLINGWVKHCTESHPRCVVTGESNLPKRVIYVGSDDDNSTIRLYQGGGKASYIALSHCWGKSRHIITEKKTLDCWCTNIPWKLLPRTFQDAIIIARKLGVSWIWIDSLCIIQDDATDWEIESAKMASIYEDAFVVVAATASKDGDGGCLFNRLPTVDLSGIDEHGAPFSIFARQACSHTIFNWNVSQTAISKTTRYAFTGFGLDAYPLYHRAWCFQEHLLGRRIIHFTSSEIVWECLTELDCECGAMDHFQGEPLLAARQFVNETGRSGRDPEQHYEVWRDLVAQYSQKQITYKKDILPALSALAGRWAASFTGPYLAGLWKNNLLRGLLWKSVSQDTKTPLKYVSPSWTWTSIQRAVDWVSEGNETIYYVTILDADCTVKGQNAFGEVTTGFLKLKGPIVEGTLTMINETITSPSAFVKINDHSVAFRADLVLRCESLIGKKVYCLRYCTDVLNSQTRKGFERALILTEHKDPSSVGMMRMYQRIGVMEHYPVDEWHAGGTEIEIVVV